MQNICDSLGTRCLVPTMVWKENADFEFSITDHEMISNRNGELNHLCALVKENKPTVRPPSFKEEGKENNAQGFLECSPCSIPMIACLGLRTWFPELNTLEEILPGLLQGGYMK